MMDDGQGRTLRRSAPALRLLRQALGPPDQIGAKARRLWEVLSGYGRVAALRARMERLRDRGVIDQVPTPAQLLCGSADMLRFWISPAAADYYERQGISYGLHQVLRFLEEPASLADPVGFFSSRDGIIGHLMQVVHANPVYDLQLLLLFEDGLDELEAQIEQMLAGTHPRAAAIAAIVEEADYHERLLAFVRRFRQDPRAAPLLRSNIAGGPFAEIERTFGTLTEAMRYFCWLPPDLPGALRHLLTVRRFPDAWRGA